MIGELAFELGKILLKIERSKSESATLIRTLGGSQQEIVVKQKIGKYWNTQNRWDRPDGLVVVTSHRLVFLTKLKTILTATDYLSFPLEMIENLEVTRIMLVSPAIRFRVNQATFTFTLFAGAKEVALAIEQACLDREADGES